MNWTLKNPLEASSDGAVDLTWPHSWIWSSVSWKPGSQVLLSRKPSLYCCLCALIKFPVSRAPSWFPALPTVRINKQFTYFRPVQALSSLLCALILGGIRTLVNKPHFRWAYWGPEMFKASPSSHWAGKNPHLWILELYYRGCHLCFEIPRSGIRIFTSINCLKDLSFSFFFV